MTLYSRQHAYRRKLACLLLLVFCVGLFGLFQTGPAESRNRVHKLVRDSYVSHHRNTTPRPIDGRFVDAALLFPGLTLPSPKYVEEEERRPWWTCGAPAEARRLVPVLANPTEKTRIKVARNLDRPTRLHHACFRSGYLGGYCGINRFCLPTELLLRRGGDNLLRTEAIEQDRFVSDRRSVRSRPSMVMNMAVDALELPNCEVNRVALVLPVAGSVTSSAGVLALETIADLSALQQLAIILSPDHSLSSDSVAVVLNVQSEDFNPVDFVRSLGGPIAWFLRRTAIPVHYHAFASGFDFNSTVCFTTSYLPLSGYSYGLHTHSAASWAGLRGLFSLRMKDWPRDALVGSSAAVRPGIISVRIGFLRSSASSGWSWRNFEELLDTTASHLYDENTGVARLRPGNDFRARSPNFGGGRVFEFEIEVDVVDVDGRLRSRRWPPSARKDPLAPAVISKQLHTSLVEPSMPQARHEAEQLRQAGSATLRRLDDFASSVRELDVIVAVNGITDLHRGWIAVLPPRSVVTEIGVHGSCDRTNSSASYSMRHSGVGRRCSTANQALEFEARQFADSASHLGLSHLFAAFTANECDPTVGWTMSRGDFVKLLWASACNRLLRVVNASAAASSSGWVWEWPSILDPLTRAELPAICEDLAAEGWGVDCGPCAPEEL